MSQIDPTNLFSQFYDNPVISMLADQHRWTISGQIGDLETEPGHEITVDQRLKARKAPIDMVHLLTYGRVRGAWSLDQSCLVTLPQLRAAMPMATNNAFYLQSHTDGIVMVDIEPTCPPHIMADLITMSGILYAELSMSGAGYHLLTRVPTNLGQFPNATGKRVLRHPKGWYEILFDHWVTFTRKPLPDGLVQGSAALRPGQLTCVEEVYADLAALARPSAAGIATDIDTDAAAENIYDADKIVTMVTRLTQNKLRPLQDFDHDTSRWEFSALGNIYGWLITQVNLRRAHGHHYSDADVTWLLYQVARKILPTRTKHHQMRNGRPYLLDRAAALVADRAASAAAGSTTDQ